MLFDLTSICARPFNPFARTPTNTLPPPPIVISRLVYCNPRSYRCSPSQAGILCAQVWSPMQILLAINSGLPCPCMSSRSSGEHVAYPPRLSLYTNSEVASPEVAPHPRSCFDQQVITERGGQRSLSAWGVLELASEHQAHRTSTSPSLPNKRSLRGNMAFPTSAYLLKRNTLTTLLHQPSSYQPFHPPFTRKPSNQVSATIAHADIHIPSRIASQNRIQLPLPLPPLLILSPPILRLPHKQPIRQLRHLSQHLLKKSPNINNLPR